MKFFFNDSERYGDNVYCSKIKGEETHIMQPQTGRQQHTLRGTLHKIIFTNNENGYPIGGLKTAEGTISIVGYMMDPREGDEYGISGTWATHPKYGRQFQFESYEVKEPTTLHGVEEYLSSGLIHGVGPPWRHASLKSSASKHSTSLTRILSGF